MKRYIYITIALTLFACSTTTEVRGPDGGIIYETTCNGSIRSMGDCMNNAFEKCGGAYEVVDRNQSQSLGSFNGNVYSSEHRSMAFKCK